MIAIQAGDDTVKEMRSEDARLFDQMEVVGAVRGKGGEIFVKSYQNGNFPPGTKLKQNALRIVSRVRHAVVSLYPLHYAA